MICNNLIATSLSIRETLSGCFYLLETHWFSHVSAIYFLHIVDIHDILQTDSPHIDTANPPVQQHIDCTAKEQFVSFKPYIRKSSYRVNYDTSIFATVLIF